MGMFKQCIVLCLLLVSTMSNAHCRVCGPSTTKVKQAIDEKTVYPTVLAALDSNKLFSTFSRLVKKDKMDGVLKSSRSITVLVPTNIAFATMPKKQFIAVLTQKKALSAALRYLMVKGNVLKPAALSGDSLQLAFKSMTINGIHPIGIMHASNGLLIIMNRFLLKS